MTFAELQFELCKRGAIMTCYCVNGGIRVTLTATSHPGASVSATSINLEVATRQAFAQLDQCLGLLLLPGTIRVR